MNTKQVKAIINFMLKEHKIMDAQGNIMPPLVWNKVPGIVDFYENHIYCEIEANVAESFALALSRDNLKITEISLEYNGSFYFVDVSKCCIFLPSKSSTTYNITGKTLEKKKIALTFSLTRSILYLIPHKEDTDFVLKFSGAREKAFEASVQYQGQMFHLSSPQDSNILTVTSDKEFPENVWLLIILCFSLYQNGEIKLLEARTPHEFLLYVQMSPDAGTFLCRDDKNTFHLLWNCLAESNNFLRQRNTIEFFLTGAKNQGEYLDFRLINLFVCMNSICGEDGQFGFNIARCFGISEGDGHWLAYVRNNMVHAGASINEAMDCAFNDFGKKQVPRGISLSRYAAYQTSTLSKGELASALYFDVIDLIMLYFMKVIGYTQPINEMKAIYGTIVK